MTLIVRNRIHPRELTPSPYEVSPTPVDGFWRLLPGQLGVAGQVVVGGAEFVLHGGETFEVMPDGEFFGHPHAAVQLDGLLADEAGGPPDRGLGGGHRTRARHRFGL